MYRIVVRESGPTPKLMRSELNRIMRAAAWQMGYRWKQEMAPKHFTHAGATEYGYAKRQGERGSGFTGKFERSYTGIKLKTKGTTNPLEYSGDSKRAILQGAPNIQATATKGTAKVRVILNAPNLNFRHKKSRIDMREEMTTVSQREGEELAKVAAKSQEDNLLRIGKVLLQPIG